MTRMATSRGGVPIRLTSERWAHIVEEHCELAGLREEPAAVLARRYGISDPTLYRTCPQPDGDDILCLLDDFGDGPTPNGCPAGGPGDYADIAPCGGNEVLDVNDILNMLDAFAGLQPCPDPCP